MRGCIVTKFCMRRRLAPVVALCLAACQGAATNPVDKPDALVSPPASMPDASSALPVVAPSPETPRPTTLVLDDFEGGGIGFGWFGRDTDMPVPGSLAPPVKLDMPRGSSLYASRIMGRGRDEGSALIGHHHFAFSADTTITFWARSALNNPERLIFAITGAPTESFWAAQKAGRAWVGKELLVPTTWTQFRLPIADLKPIGPGQRQPLFSGMVTALHFITYPESFDFWIDDIVLECPRGCP